MVDFISVLINKKKKPGLSRSNSGDEPNKQKNDIAKKMKMSDRNPLHGYNPGQDAAVYEGFISHLKRKAIDKDKATKSLNKEVSKNSGASGDDFQPTKRSSKLIKKIAEGFYKNKDIENKEGNEKVAKQYKRFYADSPNMTDDAKKFVKKRISKLQNEEVVGEAYKVKRMAGIKESTAEELELFEGWQEHKNKHAGSAGFYADKIKELCAEIAEIVPEYETYELKSIARQLEDIYESLDKTKDRIAKYSPPTVATGNAIASPDRPFKESLEEGVFRKVSRALKAKSIANKIEDKLYKQINDHNSKIPDRYDRKLTKDPEFQNILKRSVSLGRRSAGVKGGNFFMGSEWPETPKQLKYLSGVKK